MKKIVIDGASQTLVLFDNKKIIKTYKISTATNGFGEQNGSFKTPRGEHTICEKIGAGAALGAAFVARELTGEIFSNELDEEQPDRDWILTRILWLAGCEPGKNNGGDVDTKERYVYIHGGAPNRPLGIPNSKGCIRMDNKDIVELYDLVDVGTAVTIKAS